MGKEAIIKYDVKIKSTNCNFTVINGAEVSFNYVLKDGTTGNKVSRDSLLSTSKIKTGISNFKQISIEEVLDIPSVKPNIESILSINGTIDILATHRINTTKAISNEGQDLTGYKLIIKAVLKETIEYTALDTEQAIHSASYDIPFTTFIVLTDRKDEFINLDTTGIVEHIYFKELDERRVFSNATIMVKTVLCN